jgi:F-type H+-transporting ATPase subunit epsilon
MAATLRLEIVTPETRAYSEDVEMVVLPGVEGEMGILPMHVPLMTQIKPGELVVTKSGQRHHLAVAKALSRSRRSGSASSRIWPSTSARSTKAQLKRRSSARKRR